MRIQINLDKLYLKRLLVLRKNQIIIVFLF